MSVCTGERCTSGPESSAGTRPRSFYAETLPAFIARLPWLGRRFLGVLFGSVAPEVLRDPARAAVTRPVFELTAE